MARKEARWSEDESGYDTTLPTDNIYEVPCPILRALEIIGGKWKLPLLWHLADGAARFNALQRTVTGITHMMLSKWNGTALSAGPIAAAKSGMWNTP